MEISRAGLILWRKPLDESDFINQVTTAKARAEAAQSCYTVQTVSPFSSGASITWRTRQQTTPKPRIHYKKMNIQHKWTHVSIDDMLYWSTKDNMCHYYKQYHKTTCHLNTENNDFTLCSHLLAYHYVWLNDASFNSLMTPSRHLLSFIWHCDIFYFHSHAYCIFLFLLVKIPHLLSTLYNSIVYT